MHILITGAAGMIGRKLIERLVVDRALNGQPIEKLTLMDIVAATRPAGFSDHVKVRTGDLADPAIAMKAVSERPDVIFHLAGVVSGEAEVNLEKGYHVNLDAIAVTSMRTPISSSATAGCRGRVPPIGWTTAWVRQSRKRGEPGQLTDLQLPTRISRLPTQLLRPGGEVDIIPGCPRVRNQPAVCTRR